MAQYKTWDAMVLINMIATGVIDIDNVYNLNVNGKTSEFVGFDPEYASSITNIYSTLPLVNQQPIADVPMQLASLQDEVRQYNALEKSMLVRIGSITFGLPIVYTAEEKGLSVPDSILQRLDVYWIDLAVTFREMNVGQLVEMAINFALPEDGAALELVPLEYGVEMNVDDRIKRSGNVAVNIEGMKISVGEVF